MIEINNIYTGEVLLTVEADTLRGVNLAGVDLREANLTGVDLTGADLTGANLRWADLGGADLHRANLRGVNLRGANLRGANLRGSDLCLADLYAADLSEADLQDANLGGAKLYGADLWSANLSGVDLSDVDLNGADLSGAIMPEMGMTITNLSDSSKFVLKLFRWSELRGIGYLYPGQIGPPIDVDFYLQWSKQLSHNGLIIQGDLHSWSLTAIGRAHADELLTAEATERQPITAEEVEWDNLFGTPDERAVVPGVNVEFRISPSGDYSTSVRFDSWGTGGRQAAVAALHTFVAKLVAATTVPSESR